MSLQGSEQGRSARCTTVQRLHFFFFLTGDRDESLQAFACCLWGTCEAETIAVSKRNGIRAADPPSLLLHYSQRALTASASGISFPLHSSTCLQLRIVSFLRNIKLWSELLKKRWPCQALQDRQHGPGNWSAWSRGGHVTVYKKQGAQIWQSQNYCVLWRQNVWEENFYRLLLRRRSWCKLVVNEALPMWKHPGEDGLWQRALSVSSQRWSLLWGPGLAPALLSLPCIFGCEDSVQLTPLDALQKCTLLN